MTTARAKILFRLVHNDWPSKHKWYTIHNLRLALETTSTDNMEEMRLFKYTRQNIGDGENQDSSGDLPWTVDKELEPGAEGHIVNVLALPTFAEASTEVFLAMIFYNLNDADSSTVHQTNIPQIRLTTDDLVSDKYRPFPREGNKPQCLDPAPDALTLIATSKRDDLSVRVARTTDTADVPSLTNILCEQLGFEFANFSRLCKNHLFHRGGGGKTNLSGILLFVEHAVGCDYRVHVFARNESQVILLVHCMYACLPARSVVFIPKPHRRNHLDVLVSTELEAAFVLSHLNKHRTGGTEDLATTEQFRQDLSWLECNTDQCLMDERATEN